MGDSLGSKVFEVSRAVTNWTISEDDSTGVLEDPTTDVDYSTESYWSVYPPSENSSGNVSIAGNKTADTAFKRDEDLAKIEMAVLALIFILTVLGNCVVLLGIFFRRQKMTRMYYFILHLSVADLITAFFNVLTQLFWEITYRFQGGNVLCKMVKYLQILGPYSSSWVLVVTAIDRYQAICYPLSNCSWTARRSKVMLGIAWSISFISCVPQIFIFSYQLVKEGTETEPAEYDCWATFPIDWGAKAYVTWYSITVFIIPLIILVFAYTCITRAIWINFNMKAASRNHDNYERKMTRADSDEVDGQSHSQDESVFQRENKLSLRANTSQLVSSGKAGETGKKASNINLYNPSKYFLSTKSSSTSSSTSAGGGVENFRTESNRKIYRDSNKISLNNIRTTRTSTSSCTTQSSTLSPSLSGRRIMSALEDKEGGNEKSRNSLCFTSQKSFASNGLKEDPTGSHLTHQGHHHHQLEGDEEQLHLIPKKSEGNDLCHTSETRACQKTPSPSSDERSDVDGNGGSIIECMKNGSVKFSGETCRHGCYGKRCNFCHSAFDRDQRKEGQFGTNNFKESVSEPGKDLITGGGRYPMKQSSPTGTNTNPTSANNRDGEKQQSQSPHFSRKSTSRRLLPGRNRFSRKGRGGSINESGKQSTKSSVATYVEAQPRTHSVKGISRAKIKTIKLTVTIICCYIFCSSPFIAAQLWSVYDPYAMFSSFFTGPTFTILTLLASLNSCVNPYIFLFFNPNLLENCFRGIFRPKFPARHFNNGSPLSRTLSQNKKAQYAVGGVRTPGGNVATYNRGSLRKSPGVVTRDGSLGGGVGEGSRKGAASAVASHLSPLISSDEVARTPHQISLGNGSSKGYHLEKLSERNESCPPNALELVDSIPPTTPTFPLSPPDMDVVNGSRKPENYSAIHGGCQQLCRVETTSMVNNNLGGTSTLIS